MINKNKLKKIENALRRKVNKLGEPLEIIWVGPGPDINDLSQEVEVGRTVIYPDKKSKTEWYK